MNLIKKPTSVSSLDDKKEALSSGVNVLGIAVEIIVVIVCVDISINRFQCSKSGSRSR